MRFDPTEGFFGVSGSNFSTHGSVNVGEFSEQERDVGGGAERSVFLGEEVNGFGGGAFFDGEALESSGFISDTALAAVILVERFHEVSDFFGNGVNFVSSEIVFVDVADGVKDAVFNK